MLNDSGAGRTTTVELLSAVEDKYGEGYLSSNFLTRDLLVPAAEQVVDEYGGVLNASALVTHFGNYVLLSEFPSQWRSLPRPDSAKPTDAQLAVLDIGSGFGSFALGAASQGARVIGVETTRALVDIAIQRSVHFSGEFDTPPEFLAADARDLPLASASFDLVTAWNVLEHVDDLPRVISEVQRVLRPGGWFSLVAPNYLALRREAHYLVPWLPMLPKSMGARYLSALGRDPGFLTTDIWYRTRPEVRAKLREAFPIILSAREVRCLGLRLSPGANWPRPKSRLAAAAVDGLLRLEALNPLGHAIALCAQKGKA